MQNRNFRAANLHAVYFRGPKSYISHYPIMESGFQFSGCVKIMCDLRAVRKPGLIKCAVCAIYRQMRLRKRGQGKNSSAQKRQNRFFQLRKNLIEGKVSIDKT